MTVPRARVRVIRTSACADEERDRERRIRRAEAGDRGDHADGQRPRRDRVADDDDGQAEPPSHDEVDPPERTSQERQRDPGFDVGADRRGPEERGRHRQHEAEHERDEDQDLGDGDADLELGAAVGAGERHQALDAERDEPDRHDRERGQEPDDPAPDELADGEPRDDDHGDRSRFARRGGDELEEAGLERAATRLDRVDVPARGHERRHHRRDPIGRQRSHGHPLPVVAGWGRTSRSIPSRSDRDR